MPEKNAPAPKAKSLVLTRLTPEEAAAISSSRIAIQARPKRESRRRILVKIVKAISDQGSAKQHRPEEPGQNVRIDGREIEHIGQLRRAEYAPGIGTNRKESHIAQVEQTGETNHNVETEGQDHIAACIAKAGQATICAKPKQEWIEDGVEDHEGNQQDQIKALGASAA